MKKLLLLSIVLLSFFPGSAQSVSRIIGCSPFQDSLWVFDTTNMAAIRRLAPNMPGFTITGMNGMAKHPITGEIYVVAKVSGVTGRVLGKMNPVTAEVTQVGNLGDNFSSITFNSSGTLYGTTGDGATVPETAYIISTVDASKTVLRALGNGADGEVICFNPDDNMIYHWSGNGTVVFEKFDTATGPITNLPITGAPNGETFGAVYLGSNYFMISNISSTFKRWHASGVAMNQVGMTTPDDIRGTVIWTCPRLITGTPAYCVGDSTALTMNAGNGASYQWFKDGLAITGATSQVYYASSIGSYSCVVSDACSDNDGSAAAVAVTQNPLPIVSVSGPGTLCPADTNTLTGSSGGTSQWYMNGVAIIGANSASYMATAPGVYNMTKTNLNGCVDSAATGITVVAVTAPTVVLGNDTAFCIGGMVTLDAMNTGNSYLWSDATTAQTLVVSATGTYDVQVTDANGCVGIDSIDIIVNSLPMVALGADTAQCAGTVTLDAMNAGSTYTWSDATTAQTLVVSATGTYDVVVTDANGCMGVDSIDVTINALPVADITTSPTMLCIYNLPVTLTTSPAGGTITGTGVVGSTFDPQTAGAGTFYPYYTYTDANGCTGVDSIQVDVDLCLGINAVAANVISVYPNPAGNNLFIDLTGLNETVVFSMIDVAGKLVLDQQIIGGSVVNIDLSSVDKGMYMIQVRNESVLLQQRVVVTK